MPAATATGRKSSAIAIAFLVLYLLFLLACGILARLGRSSGPYGDLAAGAASLAAGFPWPLLIFLVAESCHACQRLLSDAVFLALCWSGALVNLALLVHAAGLDRVAADSLRADWARMRSSPIGKHLQRFLPHLPALLAGHFDEIRERRTTGVVILGITLVLGFASVLSLLAAAPSGATLASPDVRWSSGMLFALAGTWCRQLSTNAQLRAAPVRLAFAAAGTAWGTGLAAWSAIGWAPTMPPWAVLYSLFGMWQLWLLTATLGSPSAARSALAASTPEA